MRLTDARKKFAELRKRPGAVLVDPHAWKDRPERGFTMREVHELVVDASGILRDNHVDNPKPGSFVWHCKDENGDACEICIVFGEIGGEIVIAISAFRRV